MLSTRVGLFSEAIEYYDSALSIQKSWVSDDLRGYSQVERSRRVSDGQLAESLKLLVDAHSVLVDELGGEHQTVAATLYQIGVVQNALCEVDESISALRRQSSD
jgi:hypothetical protein